MNWMLENTSIKITDIEVDSDGTVPRIPYRAKARTQTYKPDFFIRKRNLIVEAKDYLTLGLGKAFFYVEGDQLWKTNCAKAQACLDKGYKFRMLAFDRNNERIKLPKGWHLMPREKILKYVSARWSV